MQPTLLKDCIPWFNAVHVREDALSAVDLQRLDRCGHATNYAMHSFFLPFADPDTFLLAAPRCGVECVIASALPMLLSAALAQCGSWKLAPSALTGTPDHPSQGPGVEWWIRRQCALGGGMGLHLDKDEGLWDGDVPGVSPYTVLSHPVIASVFYLTGGEADAYADASSDADLNSAKDVAFCNVDAGAVPPYGCARELESENECHEHRQQRPQQQRRQRRRIVQRWGGGPTVVLDKGLVPAPKLASGHGTARTDAADVAARADGCTLKQTDTTAENAGADASTNVEDAADDTPPSGWIWAHGKALLAEGSAPPSSGPPSAPADQPVSDALGDAADEPASRVVWPRRGRWLAFAGDRLHGVAPPLADAAEPPASRERSDHRPGGRRCSECGRACGDRVTLLVNLWRRRPRDPDCRRFPLSPCQGSDRGDLWQRYGALTSAEAAAAVVAAYVGEAAAAWYEPR